MGRAPTPLDLVDHREPFHLCLVLCQCKAAPDHSRALRKGNAISCSGRHQAKDSRPTEHLPQGEGSIREWVPRQAECPLRVRLRKNLSTVNCPDIFGQGWTLGCKGLHLGILNTVVHHQVRDKCPCRVCLLSKGHLGVP